MSGRVVTAALNFASTKNPPSQGDFSVPFFANTDIKFLSMRTKVARFATTVNMQCARGVSTAESSQHDPEIQLLHWLGQTISQLDYEINHVGIRCNRVSIKRQVCSRRPGSFPCVPTALDTPCTRERMKSALCSSRAALSSPWSFSVPPVGSRACFTRAWLRSVFR